MNNCGKPLHMVTRFAPSPTGRLHLGHGWSALIAHDLARAAGGQFRLRIEDIDGTRSRPEHVAGILEDMRWLGLDWDGPVVFQSARLPIYHNALDQLKTAGLVYPCFCTRADIAAEIAASLSAPHGPDGPLYPGTCRRLGETERSERLAREPHGWRLDMRKAVEATGPLCWEDVEVGTVRAHPLSAGDVILARKDAPTSYHLAATVDDADMGVTHVVRGQDLFPVVRVQELHPDVRLTEPLLTRVAEGRFDVGAHVHGPAIIVRRHLVDHRGQVLDERAVPRLVGARLEPVAPRPGALASVALGHVGRTMVAETGRARPRLPCAAGGWPSGRRRRS